MKGAQTTKRTNRTVLFVGIGIAAVVLTAVIGISLHHFIDTHTYREPEPLITYGEFPFTITHELDGEVKTYSDVMICQYEGLVNWDTFQMKRQWSAKTEKTGSPIALIPAELNGEPVEIVVPYLGLPSYYMGEPFNETHKEYESLELKQNNQSLYYREDGKSYDIMADKDWEMFGFKVLDLTLSPPIENTFE